MNAEIWNGFVSNIDVLSDDLNPNNERFKLLDNNTRLKFISELKQKMKVIIKSFGDDRYMLPLLAMLREMVNGGFPICRCADLVLQYVKQMQTGELPTFSPHSRASYGTLRCLYRGTYCDGIG